MKKVVLTKISGRAYADVFDEIFSNPDRVLEKGRKAQDLVMERYTWDRTIEPVLSFVENPLRCYHRSLLSTTVGQGGWRRVLRRLFE